MNKHISFRLGIGIIAAAAIVAGIALHYAQGHYPQPQPPAGAPSASSTSGISGTKTYYRGKQVCQSDNDCPAGDICTVAGPLLANQPTPATCWPKGSAIPL
jgi:hypothetical protein